MVFIFTSREYSSKHGRPFFHENLPREEPTACQFGEQGGGRDVGYNTIAFVFDSEGGAKKNVTDGDNPCLGACRLLLVLYLCGVPGTIRPSSTKKIVTQRVSTILLRLPSAASYLCKSLATPMQVKSKSRCCCCYTVSQYDVLALSEPYV